MSGSRFSSTAGGASAKTFHHDIKTQSGLTGLYNQQVTKVEHVTRPMGSSAGMNVPIVHHQGAVVTTERGDRYLVHKGSGYGKSGGETVVVDARHMSDKWSTKETRKVEGHTVSDFVKTSGPDYSIWKGDHCITSANKMTNLGTKP
ncbi:PREDICTED: uncharacterized protein LOC109593736 [Amphimedon queenslandica]|uniref:Uncharacterized protein n=1 Tax=Amphimedon queenslandica TaxID=400682 RepID=A0A1X7VKJ2_AMPQE|nr:PREDICTED: uncharacterized protein LOC109593736 [Amphimedon queenslandica]|eukprot:XP_019864313.1 PREDICTED: uncharacterized protein LOC109593736 [Amphimedon queenslandica]